MLDLTKLRYFQAVAESGSFSGAARRLGLSQPTLSIQVAKLEDELGVKLLRRRRDGVTLTAAGERLLGSGRDLLNQARDLAASVRAETAEPTGDLRIGSVNSVGIYLLPEGLELYGRRCPKVRPTIRFDHSDTIIELLKAGDLDVALTADPEEPATAHKLLLTDDPLVLVCGPGHRLWGRRQARPQDLDGERLVGFDSAAPTAKLIESVLKRRRVRMEAVIRATQIAALVRMVEVNMGLGFLPRMAVATEIEAGRLHAVSFAAEDLHRGIWLSWEDDDPFPAREALAEAMRAAAEAQARRLSGLA